MSTIELPVNVSLKDVSYADRMQILRQRKRTSRNDETVIFNSMIYLLVKVGFNVKVKRTKKTTRTIKMLLPKELTYNGEHMQQDQIMELSSQLLLSTGFKPLEKEIEQQTTAKRAKRSKEAKVNNGVLFILSKHGYTFDMKKVRKAHWTERLVRVNSITSTLEGKTYSREELCKIGMYISNLMDEQPEKKCVEFGPEILIESIVSLEMSNGTQQNDVHNEIEHKEETVASFPQMQQYTQPIGNEQTSSEQGMTEMSKSSIEHVTSIPSLNQYTECTVDNQYEMTSCYNHYLPIQQSFMVPNTIYNLPMQQIQPNETVNQYVPTYTLWNYYPMQQYQYQTIPRMETMPRMIPFQQLSFDYNQQMTNPISQTNTVY